MLCQKCGAIVPEGVQYCQSCGNDMFKQSESTVNVDDEPTVMAGSSPLPPEYTAPTSPDYGGTAYVPPSYTAPVSPGPPKKGSSLSVILAAVSVVAVAAIAVAVLFGTGIISVNKNEEETTEASVTQKIEETTKSRTPERTTKEVTTEAPTEAPYNDEYAIKAAIGSFFVSVQERDGARFKRVVSAYINADLVESIADWDLTDASTVEALKAFGMDANSKTLPYDFGIYIIRDDLGDADNITKITVEQISVEFLDYSEQSISDIPQDFAKDFGIYLQNPPEISLIAMATSSLTIHYADGSTSSTQKEYAVLKENGEWKVLPA